MSRSTKKRSNQRSLLTKNIKNQKNKKKQFNRMNNNSNVNVNDYLLHNKGKNIIPKSAQNMGYATALETHKKQQQQQYMNMVKNASWNFKQGNNNNNINNNKNNDNQTLISKYGNKLSIPELPKRTKPPRRKNKNNKNDKSDDEKKENDDNEPPQKKIRLINNNNEDEVKNDVIQKNDFDYVFQSQMAEQNEINLVQTAPELQKKKEIPQLQYEQWKQKNKKVYYNQAKVDEAVARFPIKKFVDDIKMPEMKQEDMMVDEYGDEMMKQKSYIEFKNYLTGYRDVKCYEIHVLIQRLNIINDYESPYLLLNPNNVKYKIKRNDLILYIDNDEFDIQMQDGTIFQKWNKINIDYGGTLMGQYYPPKTKYPRKEIILDGVDESFMDMNDIKQQIIYELRRHVRKKLIFDAKVNDKELKTCIDRLRNIMNKYPYVDPNISLKYMDRDEKGKPIPFMMKIGQKADDIIQERKVMNVVRILNTEGNLIKKTKKISFVVDDIPPYFIKDVKMNIGLNPTNILPNDNMKKMTDNFFRKILKCNYCHQLGHTTHSCRTKRNKKMDYEKSLKSQLDNGTIGIKQYRKNIRLWYPPPICRECGKEGHVSTASNPCNELKKCKWCDGEHGTRVTLRCPLMKKLFILYKNTIKMKMAGEDVQKWKNEDILQYDAWKKVRDAQIQKLKQKQNVDDSDNNSKDEMDDDDEDYMENVNKLQNQISQQNNIDIANKIDDNNNDNNDKENIDDSDSEQLSIDDEEDDEQELLHGITTN